jgi:arylsulfatase A-like enzyme
MKSGMQEHMLKRFFIAGLWLVCLTGGILLYQERWGAVRLWSTPPELYQQDAEILKNALEAIEPVDREKTDPRPDIVLIVMDTVRADRLGSYNPENSRTPGLDLWAEQAQIYQNATANGPWTLPSHGSMFTGLFPGQHGARGTPLLSSAQASALSPSVPTVAQLLADSGYQTAAFVANKAFLNRSYGLDRGFQIYLCEDLPTDRKLPYTTADRITALARQYLQNTSGPRFLFLNLMDAHSPYLPRPEFVQDAGRLRGSTLPGHFRYHQALISLMADRQHYAETENSWEEAYDAGVRYLDRQLSALLLEFPLLGIGPEDLVIVTADHGEYLGEHFLMEHSKDLYEEVLHVPLLVSGKGFKKKEVRTEQVQHTDLAAWILTAAKLPLPDDYEPTAGFAVSELFWSRWKDLKSPAYGYRFQRIRRAFRAGDRKIIVGDDRTFEAYDLKADPKEEHSLNRESWAVLMKARANAWAARHPAGPINLPDRGEDDAALLKALGYLDE